MIDQLEYTEELEDLEQATNGLEPIFGVILLTEQGEFSHIQIFDDPLEQRSYYEGMTDTLDLLGSEKIPLMLPDSLSKLSWWTNNHYPEISEKVLETTYSVWASEIEKKIFELKYDNT